MLKKTIPFTDLDGNTVTEDFYFNLSKAEVAELELSQKGGFGAYIQKIVDSQDPSEIIGTFKKIITMSVGKRSEDGRRFVKSEEIANDFVQTDAYSELFIELISDAAASAEFVKGVLPADLAGKIIENQESVRLPDAKILPAPDPKPWITEDREPTHDELRLMSQTDMIEALRRKSSNATKATKGFDD